MYIIKDKLFDILNIDFVQHEIEIPFFNFSASNMDPLVRDAGILVSVSLLWLKLCKKNCYYWIYFLVYLLCHQKCRPWMINCYIQYTKSTQPTSQVNKVAAVAFHCCCCIKMYINVHLKHSWHGAPDKVVFVRLRTYRVINEMGPSIKYVSSNLGDFQTLALPLFAFKQYSDVLNTLDACFCLGTLPPTWCIFIHFVA